MLPETAHRHAHWLRNLGVDFVVFDCSNVTKMSDPDANGIFQASRRAIEGFRSNQADRIKVAYQLSLTCWQQQCHANVDAPHNRELYTWNDHVRNHVESIYAAYLSNPDVFETVPTDGNKPLLIFYCNTGRDVYDPNAPDKQYWPFNNDLREHYPRWPAFNERVSTGELVRNLFSVRFSLHCPVDSNFSDAPEIWPFQCDTEGSIFNEAGYAALRVGNRSRNIAAFDRMVEASREKSYLILRCFNEFSTTDEDYRDGHVYTMEVNNRLHHHDEQGGDPWFHWNRMRTKLASVS